MGQTVSRRIRKIDNAKHSFAPVMHPCRALVACILLLRVVLVAKLFRIRLHDQSVQREFSMVITDGGLGRNGND